MSLSSTTRFSRYTRTISRDNYLCGSTSRDMVRLACHYSHEGCPGSEISEITFRCMTDFLDITVTEYEAACPVVIKIFVTAQFDLRIYDALL
jgi:hypothetical protein